MSKSFLIDLNINPDLVITKARELASQAGGRFEGDTQNGHFRYNGITGDYRIFQNQLELMVDRKPPLLPWNLVESSVRKWFQQIEQNP